MLEAIRTVCLPATQIHSHEQFFDSTHRICDTSNVGAMQLERFRRKDIHFQGQVITCKGPLFPRHIVIIETP